MGSTIVNSDGIDDLIVSTFIADPNGKFGTGQQSGFSPTLERSDLLSENGGDSSQGFVINGITRGDHAGISVSSAGNFNGDGIDDLIIDADNANSVPNNSGESYLI
ncbi:hypothetical protein [Leptothoe spongobia]|uniref:Uncharacterized protein n=1 Tax=Leptothoe spongobia TAU-MAC 1115 TaxID=1967444 RepID=A0A947DK88_9CYAN|nr:hypothetical protein [Leptothoe spongobia]MBT9317745.1 hypothetical protein [Leptothoe spongobia TAU-MAC 1115]